MPDFNTFQVNQLNAYGIHPMNAIPSATSVQTSCTAIALVAVILFAVHGCMRRFLGFGLIKGSMKLAFIILKVFGLVFSASSAILSAFAGADRWVLYGNSEEELKSKLSRGYIENDKTGLYRDASRETRLNIAKKLYSEEKYPFLYWKIPAHIRNSIIMYGRIFNGSEVTELAWRHWTLQNINQIGLTSLKQGKQASITLFAGLSVTGILINIFMGAPHTWMPYNYQDWFKADGVGSGPEATWLMLYALSIVLHVAGILALALVTTLIMAPCIAFVASIQNATTLWEKSGVNLSMTTKDSQVAWKHYISSIPSEIHAYVESVKKAIAGIERGEPTYRIGKATGEARARGHLHGPMIGQDCSQDFRSVGLHTACAGGTGSGKTKTVLKPAIYRMLTTPLPEGYKMGAYITDGKGVLWKDIIKMPVMEVRDDIRVIGADDGMYGINLLQDMTPLELATMFGTITKQVVGESDDIFWSEQASTIVTHCATICHLLEQVPEVHEWEDFASYRPWSLMGVSSLATNPALLNKCVRQVARLQKILQSEQMEIELAQKISEILVSSELRISVDYCSNTWEGMAKETRSSVIANVNVLTGKFSSAGRLRDRFCTGRLPENEVCDVSHASNGGVIMIAVGESEWGTVGQIVAVWLKTRFYMQQRRKQTKFPDRCEKELVMFVADEFQMLATSGGSESDTEFYNIARSTGVIGFVATQSVSALEKRLGKEATGNMLNNFRSKICLRVEDQETLEYIMKPAGTVLGGYAPEPGVYETQGQREIMAPDTDIVISAEELEAKNPTYLSCLFFQQGMNGFFLALMTMVIFPFAIFMRVRTAPSFANLMFLQNRFFSTPSMKQAFEPDMRWSGDSKDGGEQMHSIVHRSEDKSLEALKGLEEQPIFRTTDLMRGTPYAFVFWQVADSYRCDMVELDTYCGENDNKTVKTIEGKVA